jgi:AmiR/NasT family two-component response regulator
MMSRNFIDEAKGLLMERHTVSEDEAFTMLIHASQRSNTKLRQRYIIPLRSKLHD